MLSVDIKLPAKQNGREPVSISILIKMACNQRLLQVEQLIFTNQTNPYRRVIYNTNINRYKYRFSITETIIPPLIIFFA